jgi:uncharacterized protein (DUF927 family)
MLRLPGTVNHPNTKKRSLGRGDSRARLMFSAPNLYAPHHAATLAAHLTARLDEVGLIRPKPGKPDKGKSTATFDADWQTLAKELKAVGADEVSKVEQLPPDLQARLRWALAHRKHLADRWAGLVDDLAAAGRDDTRSGADISLSAIAKAAGFSHLEAGLILCAFPHGKTNNDEWPSADLRLRHVARCVVHSHEPEAAKAAENENAATAELPSGFRMTAKGLFFYPEPSEKNPEPPPVFIVAPFQVVGQTRSDVGEDWGLMLSWHDRDDRVHRWAIPLRLIHRQGNEIAEELENAGLSCGSDENAHRLLKRFLSMVKITRRLRCVSRTGWHDGGAAPVFVLPGGEAFGREGADVILQADRASAGRAFRVAGTISGWQDKVAAPAVGNDRLVLFISAAFAGPLLEVLAEPSGGIHLVGDSRTGKSTAALAAASVWGPPTSDGQLRPWRGTANGLEAVAAETSDTLLILDEMGQADAREVGDIVYLLGNDAGKQRASRIGTARRRHSWRILFLSTGEITLAQKMGEAGKRATAGLEVRLANLPADACAGIGVFQNLHGRRDAAAFADELRDSARAHHGHAARMFLQQITEHRATSSGELRVTLNELRDAFLDRHVPRGATGQVRSVASRFALIAAAGELARDYGVLPWPEGEALRAAAACFSALLELRGGEGPAEDAAALAQVRGFIEAHGESRFTPLTRSALGEEPAAPDVTRTINRVGFRRRIGGNSEEHWEYWILPEAWKNEVCKGLDAKRTADLLVARKFLLGGTGRHRAALVTIPGEGKRRVYRVSGAVLGGSDGE